MNEESSLFTLGEVRDTFTHWAPRYDATHGWTVPGRRAARLALAARPGDCILDLACGTGANFEHLRQLIGNSGKVVGVDLTPAMLEIAQRQITGHGWGNVELHEADAACLPFPAASFDGAICTLGMSIIPEYVRAIDETARVLIPGGRFAVLDVAVTARRLPRSLYPLATRFMRLCTVDVRHQTVDELVRVFAEVKVRKTWRGLFYLAVALRA